MEKTSALDDSSNATNGDGNDAHNLTVTVNGQDDSEISATVNTSARDKNYAFEFEELGENLIFSGAPVLNSAVSVAGIVTADGVVTATASENETNAYSIAATDADGDTLTYELSGTDAGLFNIDAAGAIAFKSAPDFETPRDTDRDNVYELIVTANDGVNSTSQVVTITVTNENDNVPVFIPNVSALMSEALEADSAQLSIDESTAPVIVQAAADIEEPAEGIIILNGSEIEIPEAGFTQLLTVDESTASPIGSVAADETATPPVAPLVADEPTTTPVESSVAEDHSADTVSPVLSSAIGYLNFVTQEFTPFESIFTPLDLARQHPFFPDSQTQIATAEFIDDESEFGLKGSGVNLIFSEIQNPVSDENEKPVFTNPETTITVNENQRVAYTAETTDSDSDTLTYSLSGTDAALFTIDDVTGVVTFIDAPDFENPEDDNSDNAYEVIVTASDGTNSTEQIVTITVNDLSEVGNPPVFTSLATATVDENQTAAYTAEATDADGDALIYGLIGTDAALFNMDADTGVVTFINAPDFEAPEDANNDNIYEITVTANDGDNTTEQTVTITVNDLTEVGNPPVFTSLATATVNENQTVAYTAVATDADGDTLTYSLDPDSTDAGLFNLGADTGVLTFKTAPDFENPEDANNDNTYEVIVTASDGINAPTEKTVTIIVTNVNENAPVFDEDHRELDAVENQTAVYTAMATDADSDPLTYGLIGTDAALFSIDADTGVVTFINAPDFENPEDGNNDNLYEITVTASDGINAPTEQTVTITVTNENETPVFSADTATIKISENETDVFYTAEATDADGDPLAYSLSGDAESLFTIDASTGDVTVISADGIDSGTYEITVTATDSDGLYDTQNVTITVATLLEIDLGSLGATDGFVILGDTGDLSGFSVSGAGDLNGDGLDDLIIGTTYSSNVSYVIFGKTDNTNTIELSNLDATDGFVINGISAGDHSGYSVSNAGDVNGDGLDDLIIGAYSDDPNGSNSGASFVVFGTGDGSTIELSDVEEGNGGFAINGVSADDRSGRSVSSAGDVNGDGLDDLIIGAPGNNDTDSGNSYVVFGKADTDTIELSAVENGTGGFVISGNSGFSVSSAGDVNGDGLDDLIIGAPGIHNNGNTSVDVGESYVVFGKADTDTIDLGNLDATDGFAIHGVDEDDRSGTSVSSAGDINGDGLDDLIIGTPRADADDGSADDSGASFVIFGTTKDVTAIELTDVETGTGGFVINGSMGSHSGFSVSSAGDVNGDGLDDLIIGASYAGISDGSETGASYVVFGKTDTDTIELSDLTLDEGFVILGDTGDHSGFSVSSAGDVNGDGFDDLIVGTPYPDNYAGSSYVIFGGQGTSATVGTSGDDRIEGDGDANQIVAGLGDDELIGNGGADVLRGGAGDDLLAISDANFASLDGGTGTDTLRLDGTNLDLTTIANNRLSGIEVIDLNGNSNALTLDTADILTLVGSEAANDLRINGDLNNTIIFAEGSNFVDTGTQDTVDGFAYNVYMDINLDSSVRVLIEDGVKVEGDLASISSIELSNLDATDGFVINGIIAGDVSGFSVSNAGDVNGDGLDDLIIGAHSAYGAHAKSGVSYVVFGTTNGTDINLVNLDATDGFVINGASEGDNSGWSVSSAGDVNGDGFDDLIIGAPKADFGYTASDIGDGFGLINWNSGASYIVFGKADADDIELHDLDVDEGFVLEGVGVNDDNLAGYSVSSAGDVNGDGLDDLIIGVPKDDPNWDGVTDVDGDGDEDEDAEAGWNSGASYVVFGTTRTDTIKLADLDATDGFVINGISTGDYSGASVSNAGDVNGDGLDDLIIGAWGDDPNGTDSGAIYVVFGTTDVTAIELSDVKEGNGGFVINGSAANDHSGGSVSSAGDVNGDGLDDLIIGNSRVDTQVGYTPIATSYVVFGTTEEVTAIELSEIENNDIDSGGFAIHGVNESGFNKLSVSNAGDVNGDGLDDLIVGVPYADGFKGISYVVFGKTDSEVVELEDLQSGVKGFVINGHSSYSDVVNQDDPLGFNAGWSVSSAGDVNGDGFDDLIIGTLFANNKSGASYVIYGGQDTGFTGAEIGTSGDDTLDDGADVQRGGAGDDILVINDASFASLDGGTGTDILRFDAAITLDFTTLSDNKITGIERIDLAADGGDSIVTLNLTDVLSLSDTSTLENPLYISGNSGDQVNLINASYGQSGTWEENANDNTYEFISNGEVLTSVLVDTSIEVQVYDEYAVA